MKKEEKIYEQAWFWIFLGIIIFLIISSFTQMNRIEELQFEVNNLQADVSYLESEDRTLKRDINNLESDSSYLYGYISDLDDHLRWYKSIHFNFREFDKDSPYWKPS